MLIMLDPFLTNTQTPDDNCNQSILAYNVRIVDFDNSHLPSADSNFLIEGTFTSEIIEPLGLKAGCNHKKSHKIESLETLVVDFEF